MGLLHTFVIFLVAFSISQLIHNVKKKKENLSEYLNFVWNTSEVWNYRNKISKHHENKYLYFT